VFSWRAFVADQAIAIMAYLGGFLLLVATLAFEVGGWQDLANGAKLAAVVVVYVVFGALGITLRRSVQLRTVGRAYLGVFALMTPLVALAVYRFELQPLGFPIAGMVCVAAAYAAAIYLLLAQRTGFVAYAYLGWTALTAAALAVVPWASATPEWYPVALAAASVVLVVCERLGPRRLIARLVEPAMHLGAVTSAAAALGTLAVGASVWSAAVQGVDSSSGSLSVAALALAAAGVSLVGFLWEWAVSDDISSLPSLPVEIRITLDVLATAYAALAIVGIAVWLGADRSGVSVVLAALAVAIIARVVLLRWLAAGTVGLRYALEALAATLAAGGAWNVAGNPAPNTPLLAALSAGFLVTLAAALLEDAPWIVLAAGLFLSLDYHTLLLAIAAWTGADRQLTSTAVAARVLSNYTLALIFALWLAGLALSFGGRWRRYAWPVLLTALGNALYECILLLATQSVRYETAVLAVLALAALVAGWRMRQPVWAGVTTGLFGVLAATTGMLVTDDPAGVFLIALVPVTLALGVRRWLGRDYAYGPYLVALWAAALASRHLEQLWQLSAQVAPLGLHLSLWLLLLVAAAALLAALMERAAWTMIASALLALAALVIFRPDVPAASVALVIAFAGIGVALRQYRGRWWSVPWHGAAALGALLAARDIGMVRGATHWEVTALLGFAALAYLVALHERQPWATAATTAYALLAVWTIPGPGSLVPTLAITFGAALAGGALRLRLGRDWALALYTAGAGASVAAIARISPYNAGVAEALLLLFAATAYGLAVLERRGPAQAIAGLAPALYAGAAAVAQPDAHALLPLALALGLAGLGVSRLSGPRWGWPFYAAAAVAGALCATMGLREPGFEALALLALALVSYAVAASESRPDLLPLALLLGGLALAAEIGALGAPAWLATLAFAALSWVYYAGAALWRRIPWLRSSGVWWPAPLRDHAVAMRIGEPRTAGVWIHQWGGLAVATGTPLGAALAANGLSPHSSAAQAGALALFSLAGLLVVHERITAGRVWLYVAGGFAALALSWEARWLGADNVQAFVLAPGSYLIVAGSLMPADDRLGQLRRLGRQLTLAGMLVLLLPTVVQSFVGDSTWIYALLLAGEALALAGYGVGSRSRLLVLTGSLFVGVAALRGAALAVDSGVPVALVIALLALLLMGLATWLSLRARRDASPA
jgi:hypothetical protein